MEITTNQIISLIKLPQTDIELNINDSIIMNILKVTFAL